MSCDRMENDGMRYIDGEMTPVQAAEFEKHLAGCETCRRSIAELGRVDSIAGRMRIGDPMDVFWEGYWKSIYRRGERRGAWILILIGAAATVLFVLIEMGRNFGPVTFLKVAVTVLAAGFALLLVSVVRERVHQKKTDRYRDIIR